MDTILLVEDEESIGFIVRAVLSRRGYRTLYASTADQARGIWKVFREDIRLLITDNALPDGSGVALAESLRAEKTGLPVIVASGTSHLLPPGFLLLEKPFEIVALIEKVEQALGPAMTPPGHPE